MDRRSHKQGNKERRDEMSEKNVKEIQISKEQQNDWKARQALISHIQLDMMIHQQENSDFMAYLFQKYSIERDKTKSYELTNDGKIRISDRKDILAKDKKIVTPAEGAGKIITP